MIIKNPFRILMIGNKSDKQAKQKLMIAVLAFFPTYFRLFLAGNETQLMAKQLFIAVSNDCLRDKAPFTKVSDFPLRLFGVWLFRHLNWSENWQNPPETSQPLRPQVSEEAIAGNKAL